MDKLTKAQKDEYATVFSILALYDGGVSFRLQHTVDICEGNVVT